MITLIAALSRNRVIGRGGDLPWRLPEDSRHFRRATLGKAVIMGRGEYETRKAPLPDRLNIVMTRQRGYQAPGCTVVPDADEALRAAAGHGEIMIAGGQQIYEEFLPRADRMVLTLVDAEVEGDTFFPEYEASQWREVERLEVAADERHAYAFSIVTLERT